ncbi:Ig-like domain-containing protein [Dietzia aerolata]|nr:Ig-like domain-containing protein [Dietzia aerolata]
MGTSVWLAQPVNPEVNQTVMLRATAKDVPDGGLVGFSVDGVHVGDGTVSDGQATLEWTPTTAGTKQVKASFGQTGTHGGSTSQDRTVVVSPTNVASTVAITTSGDLKVGQSVRITATVSPEGAGGEVEFFDDNNPIGHAPVGADGTAAIDWIPSVAGQRSIDANFSGRTGVNPSNSGLAVNIAEADPESQSTTTTLADIESVQVGHETTLKATVVAGEVGGTVTFYDGSTVIGTAPVQADGTATMPWTPTTDGDRTIRAAYSGHGVYLASQDTESVFVAPKVVNPDPDPDPVDPTEPGTGSLGSLTGSGGGDSASGSLGSLSSFGS